MEISALFLNRLGTITRCSTWVLLLGLILIVITPLSMSAQSTTADLVGTVTDSTGAIVPGADINVTDKGTSEVRRVKSATNGDFAVNDLPPGTYSVTVTSASFKTFEIPSILLAAGDKPRLDAKLEIGTSSQTVTVEATTPLLQSESSTLQSSVNQLSVQNVPLNGRNYVQLVQMVPGANEGPPSGLTNGTKPDDKRQSAAFSANGQSDVLNNNMIDGIDNNERLIGSLGVRPSVDAISEIHVQTSVYTADTGRTPGAAVNVITKSGTNSFHGTAYEYFRNDIFNTYPYQFGAHNPKLELRQNQFGGSVGGPIKKDKLFFFGDYEAFRQVAAANPTTSNVPTLLQYCAIHSSISGSCAGIGGTPASILPAGATLDPAGLAYAQLYPAPNAGNSANGSEGLFVASSKNSQFSNVTDGKFDYQINQNNSLAGRYSYNRVKTYQPGALPTVTLAGDTVNPNATGGYAPDIAHSASLTYVHTISSALLLTGQVGYLRVNNQQYPPMFLTGDPPKNINAALGQANVNVDSQSWGLARVGVSGGYASLGGAGVFYPLTDFSEAYQYQGALAYTHGAHNFKFGSQLLRQWATSVQSVSGAPQWQFPSLTGLLEGQYGSALRSDNLNPPSYRWWEIGEFAQDDWHATRDLTLNLGIRYDIYTPKTAVRNILSNWDNVGKQLAVAGTPGVSATTNLTTRFGLFSPRVGFAYTVRQGLLVRGGFGMSFFPTDITSNPSLKNQPFNASYGPVAYNTPGSVRFAAGAPPLAVLPATNILGAVRGVPTNFRPGESIQYNLSTQKDFHGNVVTIAYVGVQTQHMPQSLVDINAPPPGVYASSAAAQAARPNYAKYPHMTTIAWYASEGWGNYNSAQLSVERRLSNGLSFSVNYAYARELDNFVGISNQNNEGYGYYMAGTPQGDSYEKANSDLDLRNRAAATANYTLPFFKETSGFKAAVLKSWQINTLSSWAAGQPTTITNAANISGQAYGSASTDRPNQVGNPMLPAGSRDVAKYFNTAAFVAQSTGTVGSTPRNSVYGPHYRHVDLSLIKLFPIREAMNLEFRAEAFNITNTANFATPVATRGSATFGVLNAMSASYNPRLYQFALKLDF
jgi:outer membrane receptor protein involved in Fe transport